LGGGGKQFLTASPFLLGFWNLPAVKIEGELYFESIKLINLD